MKHRLGVLLPILLVSLILSSCDFLAGDDNPNPSGDDPALSPTPDVGSPEGLAQSFLNAWMARDYTTMYGYLSPNSQADYALEEFTSIYTSTASAMQLVDLEATLRSSLPGPNGDTAEAAFSVTYNTRVIGPIVKELTMRMVLTDNRWGIVWRPSLIFEELAGGSTLQLEVETPSRANIYDRNGQWLVAGNVAAAEITIVPGEVNPDFEDQMLDVLSSVLRMPPDEILQQYAGFPDEFVVAIGETDLDTIQANWDALSPYFPSPLNTYEKSGRRYFNLLAPHVLGYTSFIQREQLEYYQSLGYQGDEIIGQAGLEAWGEQYLAGTRGGALTAWTTSGQYSGEVARRDSVPAQSLYTALDRDLQIAVQDAIEDAYREAEETWAPGAGGAAVVVLDVNNGDVLAMASYPLYDPNILHPYNAHSLATDSYVQDLFNNPLKPFLNRATQGVYPPGSVFKIVSAIAALDSGLFEPDTSYTCTGEWNEMGDFTRYDWLEGGHGELTLAQGLTASCNPWFYHIGLALGQQDFSLLSDYAKSFFLGQDLGLAIEENTGQVPDPDWLFEQTGETWSLNDSVNLAVGQGALQISPVQVAVMVAAVANGGTIYQPQFVDRIGLIGEDPTVVFEPVVLAESEVSEETLAVVRESMHNVTSDYVIGTAEYRLGNLAIPVAGKTGTAQVSGTGNPLAWFAGFAPYEDPEIAIVVMVENAGQGSSVAAPIFRRIVERYYGLPILPWPRDWSDPDLFDFVDDGVLGE